MFQCTVSLPPSPLPSLFLFFSLASHPAAFYVRIHIYILSFKSTPTLKSALEGGPGVVFRDNLKCHLLARVSNPSHMLSHTVGMPSGAVSIQYLAQEYFNTLQGSHCSTNQIMTHCTFMSHGCLLISMLLSYSYSVCQISLIFLFLFTLSFSLLQSSLSLSSFPCALFLQFNFSVWCIYSLTNHFLQTIKSQSMLHEHILHSQFPIGKSHKELIVLYFLFAQFLKRCTPFANLFSIAVCIQILS